MNLNKPLQNQGVFNSDFKRNKKKHYSETQNDAVSWIYNLSEQTKTDEELVQLIVVEIEAKPIFYKHVNDICNHLNQVMRFFYRNPYVEIKLFGSAFTKLAIEESDVDIFLDFGGVCKPTNFSCIGNLPEPPEELLRTLKNKVRKFGYFTRPIPIFARAPIVHCIHRSGISCDISFTSALSVSNSQLIKFYLSLDNRIKQLILIIKFLLKRHGLLGQNNLTSFCLVVLILFFLQQLPNPLIPSVSFLQNLAKERKIVCDWDASFTTDIHQLPKVNSQLSVTELLKKFFEFYATFEFGFYVISPFTGKSYVKPILSNPNLLPEEFSFYKENFAKEDSYRFDYSRFMCVQSVFNHSINIAKNVTQNSLIQFQELCCKNTALGKELLDKNGANENKLKYLIKLFDQDIEGVKRKNLKTNSVVIFVGQNLKFDNGNCTEDDLRNEWSKSTFNSVKDILTKVMKCDLEPEVSEDETASFINEEKTIKCEFHYPELIQKKRTEFKNEFDFPKDLPSLNKEEIISSYICDTMLQGAKKQSLKFEIRCSVRKRPTSFHVNLESNEREKPRILLIEHVFQFIKNNFPKWIK